MFILKSVSYVAKNHLTIIDRMSATLPACTINWCYGYSGSGVTTLLRLLCRELVPSDGKICIDHQDLGLPEVHSLNSYRQCISIFQPKQALLPNSSLLENIAFPLFFFGDKQSQAQQKSAALLDLFGLSSYAETIPSLCPQAVVVQAILARLLIVNPKVLVIDRFFSQLDQPTQQKVAKILNSLVPHGLTVVVGEDRALAADVALNHLHYVKIS